MLRKLIKKKHKPNRHRLLSRQYLISYLCVHSLWQTSTLAGPFYCHLPFPVSRGGDSTPAALPHGGGRAAPCSGRGAPGATSLPPPAAGTGLRERLTPSSVAGAWPRIKPEPGAANPTPGRAVGEAALVHVADISGHRHRWRCREPHRQAAPPRGFAPGQTHVHPSLLSPRSPRSPTVPPGGGDHSPRGYIGVAITEPPRCSPRGYRA